MDTTSGIALGVLFLLSLWIGKKAEKKGRSLFGFFFLSMLASPLISLIIVNRLSSKLPENTPQHISPSEETTDRQSSYDTLPPIRFCRKCGFELIEGSDFCSHCGTKVIKE